MADKHIALQLHIIWSTAHGEPRISRRWRERMYKHLGSVVREKGGMLKRAGGTADHIHACLAMPTTTTVADMVHAMKTDSAEWVRENCPNSKAFSWQEGYGAFSVSKTAEANICKYILDQEEHHKLWSFQQEFVSLLRLHQIDYDERYLWD